MRYICHNACDIIWSPEMKEIDQIQILSENATLFPLFLGWCRSASTKFIVHGDQRQSSYNFVETNFTLIFVCLFTTVAPIVLKVSYEERGVFGMVCIMIEVHQNTVGVEATTKQKKRKDENCLVNQHFTLRPKREWK
jgi:hypothetical protein